MESKLKEIRKKLNERLVSNHEHEEDTDTNAADFLAYKEAFDELHKLEFHRTQLMEEVSSSLTELIKKKGKRGAANKAASHKK